VSLSNAAVLEAVQHRQALTGYCHRILGSAFEADDAVQETMVRAWTRRETFEGRSSVHSWLYRIATNVCLDMLRGRRRRAVPMGLGGLEVLSDRSGPLPGGDPAEAVVAKETIRLALLVALQHLPARQRAVLVLREVLRWTAPEVAELLGTSVASVNSALQRARATLASRTADDAPARQLDTAQQALLDRYVVAFEHHDVASLILMTLNSTEPGGAGRPANTEPVLRAASPRREGGPHRD
jgi:RNA polymerase sigma-70 factor (ECF subfamily)